MSYEHSYDVDDSFFSSKIAVGGNGGGEFYCGLNKGQGPTSGVVVRSLQTWHEDNIIFKGLEVELSDGSRRTMGNTSGAATERFFIAPGEKITSLEIWKTLPIRERCGGFELTTDQKRTFKTHGIGGGAGAYEPNLGSGILVGVFGRSGAEIDCLGFALLRKVQSAQLFQVEYPDINTLQVAAKPKEITAITYDNTTGTRDQSYTFRASEKVETSESWSVTAGLEVGVKTEVKAGIPLIADVTTTLSLAVSSSSTHQRSNKKITEKSYEFPIIVPAGQRLLASAVRLEGYIDTPYTARMKYVLDSGVQFDYVANGTYTGISTTQVKVTTEIS